MDGNKEWQAGARHCTRLPVRALIGGRLWLQPVSTRRSARYVLEPYPAMFVGGVSCVSGADQGDRPLLWCEEIVVAAKKVLGEWVG